MYVSRTRDSHDCNKAIPQTSSHPSPRWKWTETGENGRKWVEMDRKGWNWTETGGYGQKQVTNVEMDGKGWKWTKMCGNGRKRVEIDGNG